MFGQFGAKIMGFFNFVFQLEAEESVIKAGGAVPAKLQVGSDGGRAVGVIGIVGYTDNPAVVAAVEAAAQGAYKPDHA